MRRDGRQGRAAGVCGAYSVSARSHAGRLSSTGRTAQNVRAALRERASGCTGFTIIHISMARLTGRGRYAGCYVVHAHGTNEQRFSNATRGAELPGTWVSLHARRAAQHRLVHTSAMGYLAAPTTRGTHSSRSCTGVQQTRRTLAVPVQRWRRVDGHDVLERSAKAGQTAGRKPTPMQHGSSAPSRSGGCDSPTLAADVIQSDQPNLTIAAGPAG
jgi:hypothetical protein